MPRNAADEIFGYVNLVHEHLYDFPLEISFEGNTSFRATRDIYEPLEGWNGVIGASPKLLLKKPYDKVIYISRSLQALCKAQALYHRKAETVDEYIDLILNEYDFFENIKRKWERLEEPVDDPRFYKLTLEDWNKFPRSEFSNLLDFLGFPKEGRPLLLPVKFCPKTPKECSKFCEFRRDFEGYSNNFLPKDHEVCENIEVIRNRY